MSNNSNSDFETEKNPPTLFQMCWKLQSTKSYIIIILLAQIHKV